MPGASMLLRWLCLEMPTAIVEMVNALHSIVILVSDCQGSRLPQTQWLETTQVYYLVLGVRSPKSVSLG